MATLILSSHITLFFRYTKRMSLATVFSIAEIYNWPRFSDHKVRRMGTNQSHPKHVEENRGMTKQRRRDRAQFKFRVAIGRRVDKEVSNTILTQT